MTQPRTTPLRHQSLAQKERSHLKWLATNGASPETIILAIMSAGRVRGWAPSCIAQEIALWFHEVNFPQPVATTPPTEDIIHED